MSGLNDLIKLVLIICVLIRIKFYLQIMFEMNKIRTEIMSIPSDATHGILEKHLLHAASEARSKYVNR
jgi:hypothetical protein